MPTAQRSRELLLSLVAGFVIVALYLAVALSGVPAASSPVGHWMGVVGFILMLGAETLYSWRKQQRGPARGRMSTWLEGHVFMGLIGPLLVLLHSAWRLGGLAGWTLFLTVLMVVSGFVCRYVYTALPRTVDGAELTGQELAAQLAGANTQLQAWALGHPRSLIPFSDRVTSPIQTSVEDDLVALIARGLLHWRYQQQLRRELRSLSPEERAAMGNIAELLDRRYRLETQARSLAVARRMLILSRAVHIVLGVVLFLFAFIHIGAALYYVTLAR